MRLVLALALLAIPATAIAEPIRTRHLGDDVFQNTVYTTPDPAGNQVARAGGAATGSHLLYINNCAGAGCTVTRGSDDSRTDKSSIAANATSHFNAWSDSAATQAAVISCIREKMSMYDVQITTDDPGTTPHWEIIAAGTASDLDPQLVGRAGGIAPYIDCSHTRNNGLAFVFANDAAGSSTYLCTAIIHEAGHMWGLEHNLEDRDHMAYLRLGQDKDWTNSESRCGTEPSAPYTCMCGGLANSFKTLQTEFGLATGLADITATVSKPTDGAWVKAGFGIAGSVMTPLLRLTAAMAVDGVEVGRRDDTDGVLAFNGPTEIAPGDHTVTITAQDYAERTSMGTATIHVLASCTAAADCATGTSCLGGTCYPDADVAGGLGATCATKADCSTNVCGTLSGESHCTATCDAGETCPDGFECKGGADGVCWPKDAAGGSEADDGGGCSTTGNHTGGLAALFGASMGALALMSRRRTARR